MNWLVQVGKGKGSYKTIYGIPSDQPTRAFFYYNSLNVHSGYKKRLIDPNGQVKYRVIT